MDHTSQPSEGIGSRRAAKHPGFQTKLCQMALPLAPLVQLTTGQVHPAFPATLLNFWLLTDDQLEALAHFYHQRTPCAYTDHYPCPILWRSDLSIEEKRRKIGRFIGLRGCESPLRVQTEEEIIEDARLARLAEDASEEALRRKRGWYS